MGPTFVKCFLLLLQLPEITRDADESLRSRYLSLVLDVIGLSLGVVLMTLVAFYEHRIQLLMLATTD